MRGQENQLPTDGSHRGQGTFGRSAALALIVACLYLAVLPGEVTWAESPLRVLVPAVMTDPDLPGEGHWIRAAGAEEHRLWLPILPRGFTAPAHLGYGANLAAADNAAVLADMGFDWAKGFVRLDYRSGVRDWSGVDNQLRQYLAHGIGRALLRVDADSPPQGPAELAGFQAACGDLARHIAETWRSQGLTAVAYEIWNEPNLYYEWRGGDPDPAAYAALLKAAYVGIKAADSAAIVVTGGLATTGDGAGASVLGDLDFIRGMYQAGARGYFDALGSHPYGGPTAPEDKAGITCFRRAEDQHQVMIEFGDGGTPIWATEFGWIAGCDQCDFGEHERFELSEQQQADYLVRAYRYAERNWSWMGPMFIFNLDFGAVPWYQYCDPMRWYSLIYRADSPEGGPVLRRVGVEALKAMPKFPAWP